VKSEDARPTSEMDVLKLWIWAFGVLTVAGVGYLWYVSTRLDAARANYDAGVKMKPDFEKTQAEIEGMLNVYTHNKEDLARDQPMTWFSNVWNRVGINANNLITGTWRTPPRLDSRGKFYEEQWDVQVNPKAGLPRETIAKFCHEIEKSSTRLRILELSLDRADKDGLEKDDWKGKIFVGYRHPKID